MERLIHDPNAVDASKTRHRGQELPVRLGRLTVSHSDQFPLGG